MISEWVLLAVICVFISGNVMKDVSGLFTNAVPHLAIRMEKHLITGHIFAQKAGFSQGIDTVDW